MARLRLGIVGTGGMANHHADNFKQLRGVEIHSCLDVVPGRAAQFAARHGVKRVADDLDALLAEVDAVSIVTPDRYHYEPALRTLEAGKHLLCEKPLTVSLAEARKLAKAAQRAQKAGVIGMVNFSYRRSAALQKAIELRSSGALGELRHAHGFYLQCWVAAPVWGHWTSESWLWRLQTACGSGGVLGDVGCHLLDLATAVTGGVSEIRCALGNYEKLGQDGKRYKTWRGKKLDANDSAVIELRFEHGGMGVLQTTRWATGHTNHLRLEVFGTRGALMFDLDRSYEKLDVCIGKDAGRAKWKTLTLSSAPSIYSRFVTAVRRGQADQPDIVRGAEIQAYLDACERSAESGKWEKVRPYC